MSAMLLRVLALAIICCAATLIFRTLGVSGAPIVACLGGVVMLSVILSGTGPLSDMLRKLSINESVQKYVSGALRIIGVGYLAGICADICDTLGEGMSARCVLLAGRIEILLISLPYLWEILSVAFDYFGKA